MILLHSLSVINYDKFTMEKPGEEVILHDKYWKVDDWNMIGETHGI